GHAAAGAARSVGAVGMRESMPGLHGFAAGLAWLLSRLRGGRSPSAREEGGPQAEVILRTHGKTGVGEPRIDIGSLPRLRGRVGVGVRPSQWADVDRGRGF